MYVYGISIDTKWLGCLPYVLHCSCGMQRAAARPPRLPRLPGPPGPPPAGGAASTYSHCWHVDSDNLTFFTASALFWFYFWLHFCLMICSPFPSISLFLPLLLFSFCVLPFVLVQFGNTSACHNEMSKGGAYRLLDLRDVHTYINMYVCVYVVHDASEPCATRRMLNMADRLTLEERAILRTCVHMT